MKKSLSAGAVCVVAATLLLRSQTPAPGPAERAEQLAIHRNLGKAFYENPTTYAQSVEEFTRALALNPESVRERLNLGLALLRAGRTAEGVAELKKAQQQDPALPHSWFNLGIVYKKEGDYAAAITQFEEMVKLAPAEPISQYNLGYLYRLSDRAAEALPRFEEAARLDSNLAGARFQLYNAYRAAGRAADAQRELARFQELRRQQAGAAIPEDLDWSMYSEVYEPIEPRAEVPSPDAFFRPGLVEAAREIATGFDADTAALAPLDLDGDGDPDLAAWSANGVRLFRDGAQAVNSPALAAISKPQQLFPGDFNNDGLADLAVLSEEGAALFVNRQGQFERFAASLPAGAFRSAVWIDYDHDYDLDLILLGDKSALARNNGSAGFSDMTRDFPFVAGRALSAAILDVEAYENRFDLAVVYEGQRPVLYRDMLGGKFEPQPLDLPGAPFDLVFAGDRNNDGWTDLSFAAGAHITAVINQHGRLQAPGESLTAGADIAVSYSLSTGPVDFSADGRMDIADLREGRLLLQRMSRTPQDSWVGIGLEGVKNLKLAPGARVEVKTGSLYQKKTYQGLPLLFALGDARTIDAIRITWPNGLIQNETKQPVNQHLKFKEAQRLSGSCPMIFTWNGKEFQFITDVLGVAPLGASLGDGQYFPVDHDEFIQIPGSALRAVNGKYEIRITEELREVAYLDEVKLIAVDHPARTDIFTNDKFKSPPFPEFRLFGVDRRIYPRSARDHRGNDVLPRLLKRDQAYPDGFRRDYSGVAEPHYLELDFGHAAAENQAVLILNGWLDWADGSTFRAVSQESPDFSLSLGLPYLQVKNSAGEWQTVIQDMGIPAGKPKTISVDLSGKFLTSAREVRIVTGMALYWDEIFLGESAAAPEVRLTDVPMEAVEMRFRGWSRPVIHPERKQPERFNYHQWMPATMWNPTPGLYTRYGDVKPLLEAIDDQLVLMGSGDELRFLFDAASLPALPAGWRRNFLLKVDGWAKDQDANTAFGTSVEPLPFHGMSQYPYPAQEKFPDSAEHRAWRREYNTRPALRIVRPLAPEPVRRTSPGLTEAGGAGRAEEGLMAGAAR